MSSRVFIALFILQIFGDTSTLVELPQVEKNNILETDISVRETTNKLFLLLKFKVYERPILKQYALIHNHLVSNSLHDYYNLIEIARLTRVDKIKLNNQIQHFMAILNDILDEDVKHDAETEDEYVIKHIEGFLKNLDVYTESYKYDENSMEAVLVEILRLLENKNNLQGSRFQKNGTLGENKIIKKNDLLRKNEFWVPSGRRIYLGQKTKIRDFPFMASIQIFNHFQCAGSIIKSDLIITAASCLQLAYNNRFFRENPAFLSVRVGSTHFNGGGEVIPVLEVYFHPAYDPHSLKNNLCLLRLYRLLKFTKKSRKLKKIDIDRRASRLAVNTDRITIVGWGARQTGNIIKNSYLSFALLDIYLLQDCQDVYSKKYVTHRHFCAGFYSKGGGACNRDVGGPGIVGGILTGVVSFGSPVCGNPDAPTVFTKLGFYKDWIDAIMSQDVPKAKRHTTLLPLRIITMPTAPTQFKTTFKIKPVIYTKKPTFLRDMDDVESLRILNNQGLLEEFLGSLIGSKVGAEMLREPKKNKKITKTKERPLQENQLIVRTPKRKVSYSPITTFGPPDEETTVPEIDSTVMNVDEPDELSLHKSFNRKQKKKQKKDKPSPRYGKKANELNMKLEHDIIKILEEIDLLEYVKNENKTETTLRSTNDTNLKNMYRLFYLSDNNGKEISHEKTEETYSKERGMSIIDINKDVPNVHNKTEALFDSDNILMQLVFEALTEELDNRTIEGDLLNVAHIENLPPCENGDESCLKFRQQNIPRSKSVHYEYGNQN